MTLKLDRNDLKPEYYTIPVSTTRKEHFFDTVQDVINIVLNAGGKVVFEDYSIGVLQYNAIN